MGIMVQKPNKLSWVIAFFVFTFQFSCQLEPGFEDKTSLGETGWPEKQPLIYQIPQIQETGFYQFDVFIRQDNNYPFYNCYFITEIKNSKGIKLKRGLAEAFFYDQKSGKPKGDGLGDMFSHRYTIFDKVYLQKGEPIQIAIRQFMRRDTLQGIISVGYSLKPIGKDAKN